MDDALSYLEKQFGQGNVWGLLDCLPIGISVALDVSGENIFRNSACSTFLRLNPYDTASGGRPAGLTARILHDGRELVPKNWPLRRSAWFGETVKGVELDFVWVDGVIRRGRWSSSPLYGEQGKIVGALATCEDITERKESGGNSRRLEQLEDLMQARIHELFAVDAARKKLEKRLEFLAHSGPAVLTVSLPVKRLTATFVSDNVRALTGYDPADFTRLRNLFMKLVHPKDKALIDSKREELLTAGQTGMEFRFLCKDARYRWFQMRAVLARERGGKAGEVISCWWQVDDRKRAEDRAEKAAQQTHEILDRITDGFYAVDNDWRFTYINPAAERLGFKAKDELLGKCLWDVTGKSQPFYDEYHRAKTENTAVHFTVHGPYVDKTVEVHAYPSKDGLSAFIRDVTAEETMKQKMARLDQLNLVGQMAAGISHEVRNPMTTVRGFLQRFVRKKEYSDSHEVFSLMIDELDRANGIIAEFLSIAKEEKPNRQKSNLNSIINQLDPLISSDALETGKNIRYQLETLPSLWLDNKEIRQLILNLVRNALEVTPAGKSVVIRTYLGDDNEVVLSVEDEGPGIDETVIGKIGSPFVTTKEHGTGLGLTICYGIAARHNAAVSFKTSSAGTTFFVRFRPETSL